MYFLTGPRENLETMFVLAAAYAPSNGLDVGGFKRAFALWLADQQPDVARDAPEGSPAAAEGWVESTGSAQLLASARERLRRLDPILDHLMGLAITAIFTTLGRPRPGSGSMWPGTMLIVPAPSWSEWDVIEAYVRELTRTLLWLDDHRYGHQLGCGDDSSGDALVARFQGVVVATEILTLREELFPPDVRRSGHGPPAAERRRALLAAEGILARRRIDDLLAPRARQLVELAAERIQDMLRPRALGPARAATARLSGP